MASHSSRRRWEQNILMLLETTRQFATQFFKGMTSADPIKETSMPTELVTSQDPRSRNPSCPTYVEIQSLPATEIPWLFQRPKNPDIQDRRSVRGCPAGIAF